MSELTAHEEASIRDYVNSQSPVDDGVRLVQKVDSQRIMGRRHEIYDVHCVDSRWWVITDPTNLYAQSDFPQFEQALIFHLGLGIFMAERSRRELEDDQEHHISAPWRRLRQAMDDMNDAAESEDFQGIGIKCRDALISLAKEHHSAAWIGEVKEPPKAGDFKGWGSIFSERLADGRLRTYVKSMVDTTWDLSVWLQHKDGASPVDADIVLEPRCNS